MIFNFPETRKTYIRENKTLLETFMRQAPEKIRRVLASHLPQTHGFRPGHDIDLRLMHFRAAVSKWGDAQWQFWGEFWALWFESQTSLWVAFGPPSTNTQNAIEELCRTAENVQELQTVLTKVVIEAKASRDLLLDWYRFGPIPVDESLERLILSALPAAILELPNTLTNFMEQEKKLHEQASGEMAALSKEMGGVKESSRKAKDYLLKEIDKNATTFETKINTLQMALKHLDVEVSERRKKMNGQLHDVDRRVDLTQSDLRGIQSQMIEVQTRIDGQIAQLQLNTAEDLDRRLLDALDPVTSHLESLRQQLDSLLMGRSGPSPTAWMRKIPSPLEVETIWHVKELVQHLLGNFKALGLNTQMAREMALAVVTGAASGQLVSFAGSFACDVAEACALSLNGENSWTLSLGVGVTSEQIASAVEARVDRTERWTSVVLEGLNCVPFDIVRGAVRMLMPLSQKRVLLLATISDDLTALPIDPNLFKQGPLFQLDCLTWKLASTQRCSASFAGDIVPAMAEIRGLDIGEALGEDSDFPRLDHLWRRMVYSASLVYAAVAGEEAKILPGISFGWILPYLYQFRQELVDSNQEQLIGDSPCAIRLMKDKKDELQ